MTLWDQLLFAVSLCVAAALWARLWARIFRALGGRWCVEIFLDGRWRRCGVGPFLLRSTAQRAAERHAGRMRLLFGYAPRCRVREIESSS